MIEEEIAALKDEVAALKDEVGRLKAKGAERFVSPTELAEMMHVSRNTIYVKIRSGEIYASRKTGDPRIPMSQFYPDDEPRLKRGRVKQASNNVPTMADLIFGGDSCASTMTT